MNKTIDKHKVFGSVGELLRTVEDKEAYKHNPYKRASIDNDKEFSETSSLEEAIKLARYGWPVGLDGVRRLVLRFNSIFENIFPRQDKGQELVYGMSGSDVDIGRYLSGEPECMMDYQESHEIKAGTKFQRIYFPTSYICSLNRETIFSYGSMILALAEALEGYGYRTELIGRSVITADPNRSITTPCCIIDTMVKRLDQDPDYSSYAFACAHPSMLRRLLFAINEQWSIKLIDKYGLKVGYGYGYPSIHKEDLGINDLYFEPINENMTVEEIFTDVFEQKIKSHFGEQSFGM